MDKFLDSMLGDRGCAVDGSTTTNPVAQVVDRVFDSHMGGFLGTPGTQQGAMGRAAYFVGGNEEQQMVHFA